MSRKESAANPSLLRISVSSLARIARLKDEHDTFPLSITGTRRYHISHVRQGKPVAYWDGRHRISLRQGKTA